MASAISDLASRIDLVTDAISGRPPPRGSEVERAETETRERVEAARAEEQPAQPPAPPPSPISSRELPQTEPREVEEPARRGTHVDLVV